LNVQPASGICACLWARKTLGSRPKSPRVPKRPLKPQSQLLPLIPVLELSRPATIRQAKSQSGAVPAIRALKNRQHTLPAPSPRETTGSQSRRVVDPCNEADEGRQEKGTSTQKAAHQGCGRAPQKTSDRLGNRAPPKLALWLCRNHSVILLPKFSAKEVGQRKSRRDGRARKLGRETTEQLMSHGHYRFRCFLHHKTQELGARLILCKEPYTSQTCGRCGMLNKNLGGAEIFRCPSCGYEGDRDHNGARNILLRYVSRQA
jgi:hypothetical protein